MAGRTDSQQAIKGRPTGRYRAVEPKAGWKQAPYQGSDGPLATKLICVRQQELGELRRSAAQEGKPLAEGKERSVSLTEVSFVHL